MKWKFTIVVCVALPLAFSACQIQKAIPERPEEAAVVITSCDPPFDGAVWVEIEYKWDGNTYVEIPAHWARADKPWKAGYWKSCENGYTWIPGHFKK